MGVYDIILKPILRRMDLDRASRISMRYFHLVGKIPFIRTINRYIYKNRPEGLEREVFGLQFYNPVGLGAGLDIHGTLYNDLNDLGFSFIEIGPVNAEGIKGAINHIKNDPQDDILAACIDDDYLTAFTLGYDFFDFFVIDVSADPSVEYLNSLLEARLAEQVYKPIVLKIPEFVNLESLARIIDFCLLNSVDGIETRSLEHIMYIKEYSKGMMTIIANTHVDSPEAAYEALTAGASLVEMRTGLVRQGPSVVDKTLNYLLKQKLSHADTK